jgi:DNA-binding NarL/FixJ family response regulator
LQDVIRIFLIEDETPVRAALISLISSWEGSQIIREATIDEAIEQLRSVGFDVVLLSLAGCEEAGNVTVKVIAPICGDSPLLVLVGNCSEDFRTHLLRLGANRVMPKTNHPSEL